MGTSEQTGFTADKLMFFVGFLLGGLVGIAAMAYSLSDERNALRLDAIKHGAAHWVSAPDGHPVFVWNAKDEN